MKIKLIFLVVCCQVLSWTAAATDTLLVQRLRKHVEVLSSDTLEGRGLGTDGMDRARQYIISQFTEAGIAPLGKDYFQEFQFRQHLAWIDATNIVGVVKSQNDDFQHEYILIGAHYDHLGFEDDNGTLKIYPGADDNASGVAAILEIGRYFAQNPQLLKRSLLVVAFDAEESGLRGSNHFVNNSPIPVDDIKVMFSLDMVGMYEGNKGLHLIGIASLENGAAIAQNTAEATTVRLRNTSNRIATRTDTAPFGAHAIPAIHVYTGLKSPYHKPGDTYELLDYEGMQKIVHYMQQLITELSHQDHLLPTSGLLTYAQKGFSQSRIPLHTGFILHSGSGFHHYEDEFFRADPVFAFSTGFFVQFPVSRIITLQAEFLYDYNGSKAEGGTFRRHSATMPFNIQLGTPRNPRLPVRAFLSGGPYFRYTMAGQTPEGSMDFDRFQQQEWGYSSSLGLEIFRVYIAYTARRSLTGIMKENTPKILDVNNYFTLGYRF